MARSRACSALAAVLAATALTAVGCASPDAPSQSAPSQSAAPSGTERPAGSPQTTGPSATDPSSTARQTAPSAPRTAATSKPGTPSESAPTETAVPQSPVTRADEGRVPWCTTSALSATLRPGSPGAGQRYATLVLTNTSDSPCRTRGWPGLQLVGGDGTKLPTHVVRDHGTPARVLTLAPGEDARSELRWTVVPGEGDPPDGNCPTPAGLQVIPPDQRTADRTPWRGDAVCGGGRVHERPLA